MLSQRAVTSSRYRTCDPPLPRNYLVGPDGQRSRSAGADRLAVWLVRRSGDMLSRPDRESDRGGPQGADRQLAALRQAAGFSQQEFNQACETLANCQAS